MDDATKIWLALADCLQVGPRVDGKRSETLMMAAARVYTDCGADDPLQPVAIAVLRAAGYGSAETWERLRRAAELIPRKLHAVPNG